MRTRLVMIVVLGVVGCDDIASYKGTFKGSIVEGNFVRSCFAADVTATLDFNPRLAVAPDPGDALPRSKNRISTSDGTFDRTVLEPVTGLPHDQLSAFDFPGPKRLENYILTARPTQGPLAHRDAFVVVSLREDKRVELRVIGRTESAAQACATEPRSNDAGGVAPSSSAGPREYFGVFVLRHD